jgi:acylphosphatase
MLAAIRELFAEKVGARVVIRGPVGEEAFYFAVQKAVQQLGLKGVMTVHPHSALEIELEGRKPRIESLIEKISVIRRSPRVGAMEVVWKPYRGTSSIFRMRVSQN